MSPRVGRESIRCTAAASSTFGTALLSEPRGENIVQHTRAIEFLLCGRIAFDLFFDGREQIKRERREREQQALVARDRRRHWRRARLLRLDGRRLKHL